MDLLGLCTSPLSFRRLPFLEPREDGGKLGLCLQFTWMEKSVFRGEYHERISLFQLRIPGVHVFLERIRVQFHLLLENLREDCNSLKSKIRHQAKESTLEVKIGD